MLQLLLCYLEAQDDAGVEYSAYAGMTVSQDAQAKTVESVRRRSLPRPHRNAVMRVEQVPLHSRVGVAAALSGPQLSDVAAMAVETGAASVPRQFGVCSAASSWCRKLR